MMEMILVIKRGGSQAEKDVFDINKGFEAADKFMESLKNKINREDNARERPYDEVRDLLDEAKSKLNKAKRALKLRKSRTYS